MSFSYYDKDNNLKKVDIKVGMNWAEFAKDNEKLASIFSQLDDGDGKIQFTEKMLLEDAIAQIDDLGGEVTGNDKILQAEEMKYYLPEDSLLQIKFKKEYFSLENIKQAFPENEYEIVYEDRHKTFGQVIEKKTGKEVLHFDFDKENDGYSITEFTTLGNVYEIENDRNKSSIEIRNFYNDNSKNSSFTFHDETMTSFKNPYKSEYFIGQSEIQSKMYYNQFNTQDWIQNEAIDFLSETDDEFLDRFVSEYHFYHPYLGILNQIANCKEIPQEKRDNFITETLERLEKIHGYKKEHTVGNSQIKNHFYKSENSYKIEYNNDVVTITDKSDDTKTTVLDLKKFLKDVPIDLHPKIKAELQTLPAEVLIDLAVECDQFNRPVQHERGHTGLYNSSVDRIAIGQGEINDINAYTITHELGHALDNREALTIYSKDDFAYQLIEQSHKKGKLKNIKVMASTKNPRFIQAYEIAKYQAMGLKGYMNVNTETLEYSFDEKKLEENGYKKDGFWTEKYYTKKKNLEEMCYMFTELTEAPSELYCAAMLGGFGNNSDVYITPELMEEFLKDLKRVRTLSQNERHTREN